MLSDLRFAFRSLLKTPSFAFIAVLTLALGIGANTAIFSVIHAVLLRPLPYPDSDRIVTLWQRNVQSGNDREDISPPNFLDWQERSQSFSQMAGIEPWGLDLIGEGNPETIPSLRVTRGFFEVLGSKPLLGRIFRPEEYEPGKTGVVILDYRFWRERFGADPKIIGRVLRLDNLPYEVVGVMRPEFRLTSRLYDEEAKDGLRAMYSPDIFDTHDRQNRRGQYLRVVARLRPGVTVAQAQAEMDTIAAALAHEYPDPNQHMGIAVVPLRERLVGDIRRLLLVVAGAVALVLLIACANIANLLLARATTRQRELAVRLAMGAGRWRMIRLHLAEGIVLAAAGALAGILIAVAGTQALVALAPPEIPRMDEIRIDLSALGFLLMISSVAGVLFSGFPALHFSRGSIEGRLRSVETRGTAPGTVRAFRSGLVALQISLALVLLTGTGLLVRSFYSLLQVDPGFRPEKLLLVQLFIWDRTETSEQRVQFFRDAAERLRALPGVTDVGAASVVPFADVRIDFDVTFTVTGRPAPRPEDEPAVFFAYATEDYFRTMGIPVKRGRAFTSRDDPPARQVVVINEAMARRHWPDQDPIGQVIEIRYGKGIKAEVVGIVGDLRHTGFDSEPRPQIYLPHSRAGYGSMTMVVRTSTDPALLLKPVQQTIWSMIPTLPIYSTDLMSERLAASVEERRFVLFLLSSFSLLALLLAAVGLYGVISYTTAQRTREIGIRSALGAARQDLLALILGEGFRVAVLGVAVGVAGALFLTRSLHGMLFHVGATDPLTFTSTALILILVALLASYLPARRAAAVDPAVALRYE